MTDEYTAVISETVSKLERQENCEFELNEDERLWLCPMPESSLSEKPYWLIVYSGHGTRGVCKWAGETDIDEFWFVKQGFSFQAGVAIAEILTDILFARASRVNGERKLDETTRVFSDPQTQTKETNEDEQTEQDARKRG